LKLARTIQTSANTHSSTTKIKRARVSACIQSIRSPLGETQSGETKRTGFLARMYSESRRDVEWIPPTWTVPNENIQRAKAIAVAADIPSRSRNQLATFVSTPANRVRFGVVSEKIHLASAQLRVTIALLAGSILSAEMGLAHRSVSHTLNLTFLPELADSRAQ